MLDTWIHRSGDRPLSIFVKTYYGPLVFSHDSFTSLNSVLPQLLRCRDRWESLSIRAPERVTLLWDHLLVDGAMPATKLKVIDFRDTSYPDEDQSTAAFPPDLVARLPSIQKIYFKAKGINIGASLPALKSITARVQMCRVSLVFYHFHNLEVLTMTCQIPTTGGPQPIQLPKLKELDLTIVHTDPHSETREDPFLTHLVMPNLTTLRVRIDERILPLSYLTRNIVNLLRVSRTSLRSLGIFVGDQIHSVTDDELARMTEIFQGCPYLVRLDIPKAVLDSALVDKLDPNEHRSVFLPWLERIYLDTPITKILKEDGGERYLKSLNKLVRSRREMGFKALSVHYTEDASSNWEELSRHGLIFGS